MGSTMRNVLPRSDSSLMRPPACPTASWASARPRPVPPSGCASANTASRSLPASPTRRTQDRAHRQARPRNAAPRPRMERPAARANRMKCFVAGTDPRDARHLPACRALERPTPRNPHRMTESIRYKMLQCGDRPQRQGFLCKTLSFSIPSRFIPALSLTPSTYPQETSCASSSTNAQASHTTPLDSLFQTHCYQAIANRRLAH
jgi:hypothetical protein